MITLGYSDWESEAVVDETIQPGRAGRVRFQGSWWFARCGKAITLPPGEVVRVLELCDLTLLVEPAERN